MYFSSLRRNKATVLKERKRYKNDNCDEKNSRFEYNTFVWCV